MSEIIGAATGFHVTRYVGSQSDAVQWHGVTLCRRYQITTDDGQFVTVNIAQAAVLAEILCAEVLRARRIIDGEVPPL